MKHAILLGRDPRFDCLATLCQNAGYTVSRENVPLAEAALYVFPFQATEKEILSVLTRAPGGSLAALGRTTEAIKAFCREKGLFLLPFLETEAYLLQNARETAQGLLCEILQSETRLLSEETVLVTGYGHCGREICRLLWLCGAEIWVHSRPGSLTRAAEDGWNCFPFPDARLAMFDFVVNTATSPLFDDVALSLLGTDCRLYQVAGGSLGFPESIVSDPRFRPLPALPGKHTPQSEGELLFRLILQKQNESEGSL